MWQSIAQTEKQLHNNYLVQCRIMESVTLGVRKGVWTEEEDKLLKKCIEKYGEGKWHQVPLRAGERERQRDLFDYFIKIEI